MDGHQTLTLDQLKTSKGVAKLNDMLRGLFEMGRKVSFSYGLNASTSASAYANLTDGITMTSSIGLRMPVKGSIVRHSCLLNVTTATSGDVTAEVRVNNINQSAFELEFNSSAGTGIASKDTSADRHATSFSAGDLIQFHLNETGTMIWEDVVGFIEVIFDD